MGVVAPGLEGVIGGAGGGGAAAAAVDMAAAAGDVAILEE